MKGKTRVIIIGGGALGLSTAYHLKKQRVEHITILDRGSLFEEASGMSAGIISSQLWSREEITLVKRGAIFFEKAEEESGGMLHLTRHGLLRTVSTEQDRLKLEEAYLLLKEMNVKSLLYESWDIEKRFPHLENKDLLLGIFTPEDFSIDPGGYAYALYSFLRNEGVRFLLYQPVSEIRTKGGKVEQVITPEEKIAGDLFLISAGAWTRDLLLGLGVSIPLKPYLTQAGVLRVQNPPLLTMVHDATLGLYFRPEPGGLILFGDGTDTDIGDPKKAPSRGTTPFVEEMAEKLSFRLPLTREGVIVRTWTGICSGTPDRKPLLGMIEGFENLFLAAGLNGLGLMRSPALGELMAGVILGREIESAFKDYLIDRFKEEIHDFQVREGFTIL